jgi:hypothetical protein
MFGDLKVHVLFGDGSSKLELSKWLFLHFKIYPQIILHSSYWYLVWDLFVGWSNCVSPSMSSNICLNTNYILSSLLLNFSKQKLKHQMLKTLRILQSWQPDLNPTTSSTQIVKARFEPTTSSTQLWSLSSF